MFTYYSVPSTFYLAHIGYSINIVGISPAHFVEGGGPEVG